MLELRRLADSVGRITADRSGLRAAEDDLVGSIVEAAGRRRAHRVRTRSKAGARLSARTRAWPPSRRGDAGFFFGRERFVAELVARVTGHAVSGDRRAVWQRQVLGTARRVCSPRSRRACCPAARTGRWPCCVPGSIRCARSSRRSPRRLITAGWSWRSTSSRRCSRPAATSRSAPRSSTRSWPRVRDVRRRTLVVVAVRADYYGHCAAYTELSRLLGAGHVLVGPMLREELRRAIELPARRAGLLVERELVDALLADVEGQPGALPLVSSALLELWQRRDGRALRLSDYEQAGGVQGAVARQAEQAYAQLDSAGRQLARRVLLRLGRGGRGRRRRAAPRPAERVRGRRRRAGSRRPRRGAAGHDQRG